jgi:hypothetical protein
MSRLVKKIKSGETGLCLQERLLDNIDSVTGEQIKEKQLLVYWPSQGLTRWANTKHIEFLVDIEEKEQNIDE